MKTFANIMKFLAALAVIAGAIYVAATYGDKIVAWAKKMLNKFNNNCFCASEEVTVPAEEISVQEETAQAEEADFEG